MGVDATAVVQQSRRRRMRYNNPNTHTHVGYHGLIESLLRNVSFALPRFYLLRIVGSQRAFSRANRETRSGSPCLAYRVYLERRRIHNPQEIILENLWNLKNGALSTVPRASTTRQKQPFYHHQQLQQDGASDNHHGTEQRKATLVCRSTSWPRAASRVPWRCPVHDRAQPRALV